MKTRYSEITKDILLAVAIAGVLVVASTSPFLLINLAKAIIKHKKYNKKGDINEINLSRSLAGLNKNKIIILDQKGNKFLVRLTKKGKKVVKEIQFESMKIEKQKIWDRKWRIVIFDIPEKQRRIARDALRGKLQNLGFYQIQKSVWAYPYPCEKEVQFLCETFEINPHVNIITAENIYNDDGLKKYFKLT